MDEWSTSYTFSKAATERMIAEKYKHLPISIFRPVVGLYLYFYIIDKASFILSFKFILKTLQ